MSKNNNIRPNKGQSLIAFPNDYTVVDIETTGLSPEYDSIIEISALKVKDNVIIDKFTTLVNPECYICEFITELTGITNEMVETAPKIDVALDMFNCFVSNDIIVGHNVNFDINFLYDDFESIKSFSFTNDFIDTMRLARRLLPHLEHHRLSDLCEFFNIPYVGAHRSLTDCELTFDVLKHLQDLKVENHSNLDHIARTNNLYHGYVNLSQITTDKNTFDNTHPLFKKLCVFTGVLEKMSRVDAAKIVVNFGGTCGNSVTKKTNFLILGNNDYCKTIKDGKSTKQKAAEQLKLKGYDIEIIPENVFYDMIEDKL